MANIDPLQMQFWSDEQKRAWEKVAPSVLNILFRGGVAGQDALPLGLRVLVNWDLFNDLAIDYLYSYRVRTLADILETTRNSVIRNIDAWVKSGEPLSVLESRLTPLFGRTRASNIAITEVTRIFAKGNQQAWQTTGLVGGQQWRTAKDELVCRLCGPLDGKIVALGSGFPVPLAGGVPGPPAHPRCRCWLAPVVDDNLLREQIRRSLG